MHILILSLGDDRLANRIITLFVAIPPTRICAHYIVATPFIVFQLYYCIEFQCTPSLKDSCVTKKDVGTNSSVYLHVACSARGQD